MFEELLCTRFLIASMSSMRFSLVSDFFFLSESARKRTWKGNNRSFVYSKGLFTRRTADIDRSCLESFAGKQQHDWEVKIFLSKMWTKLHDWKSLKRKLLLFLRNLTIIVNRHVGYKLASSPEAAVSWWHLTYTLFIKIWRIGHQHNSARGSFTTLDSLINQSKHLKGQKSPAGLYQQPYQPSNEENTSRCIFQS